MRRNSSPALEVGDFLLLEVKNFASSVGMSTEDVVAAFKQMETQTEASVSRMGAALDSGLQKVSRFSTYVLGALGVNAGIAVKKFASFEKVIKQIQSISPDKFEDLSSNLEKIALKTGTSATELADGLYELIQASGDIEGKYKALEAANNLAMGGFTSTAQAVNILTTVLNAYGMEAEQLDHVSDVLLKTQEKGKTTVDKLSGTIGRLIPTAAQAGVNFEDLGTSIAVMTAKGVNTAETVTAINGLLVEFQRSSSKATKTLKELYGMNFSDAIKSGKNFIDILMDIKKYAEQTGATTNDIFSNVRASMAFNSLTGDYSQYINFDKAIKESQGATQKAVNIQMTSYERQMKLLAEKINSIWRQIGEQLAPQIQSFTKYLGKIDFSVIFNKDNIQTIISMGKAIATVAVAIKGLSILTGITKTVNSFTAALSSSGTNLTQLIRKMGNFSSLGASLFSGALIGGATAFLGLISTAIIKYAAFRKAVKQAKETMDDSIGSIEDKTAALEKQLEVLEKLQKQQATGGAVDSDMKAYLENNKELDKLMKQRAILESQLSQMNTWGAQGNSYDSTIEQLEKVNSEIQQIIDKKNKEITSSQNYLKIKVQLEGLEETKKNLENTKSMLNDGLYNTLAGDAQYAGEALGTLFNKMANGTATVDDMTLATTILENKINDLNQQEIEIKQKNPEALNSIQAQLDTLSNTQHVIDVVINATTKKLDYNEIIGNISDNINSAAIKSQFTAIKTMEASILSGNDKNAQIQAYEKYSKAISNMGAAYGTENKYVKELTASLTKYNKLLAENDTLTSKTENKGSTGKTELQAAMESYDKFIKTQPNIWDAMGVSDSERLTQELTKVQNLMEIAYRNGNKTLGDSFQKQYKTIQSKLSNLNFDNVIESLKDKFELLPDIGEILGLDDKQKLEREISEYESLLQNMLENIQANKKLGIDTTTQENQYKTELSNLKQKKEELKAAEELATAKEKEKDAVKDIISTMSDFGSNMKQLGEDLSSEFLETIGQISSSISTVMQGIQQSQSSGGISSIGNMFSSIGSIFKGGGLFSGLGSIASGFSSLAGIGTAVSGVVGMVNSAVKSLSGKEKRKKLEAESEANRQAFDEARAAITQYTEAIKDNMSSIKSFNTSILSAAATAPTVDKIKGLSATFDTYIDAMMKADKDFGQVTVLSKQEKKYRSWFKSKSVDVYQTDTLKTSDILQAMGIYGQQLSLMDESQFRDFAEKLKTFGIGNLRDALGGNYVDSTLEEWKEGIFEYIEQLDRLRVAQSNLMRNSTLSDFSGMQYQSYSDLKDQYEEMYESMGLNAAAYQDEIEEMARANQVLVSSMQDVRNSFVETLSTTGTAKFSGSMSSYFTDILENVSKVIYDTAYSEIDSYFTNQFEEISNKLVNMKESGVLDFSGFWDDFNFNKILEADRIQTDYDKVINDLRSQLENRGFSQSLIDSILPTTELSERIDSLKTMLNSAMSSAIDNSSFKSFTESLGGSIYDSVKESLIEAFTDSQVYKQYIDKFFNTADIEAQLNKVGSAEEGFNVIQNYLNNLDKQLQANGLARSDSLLSTEDTSNNLGNGYYTDSSSGMTIQITQYFSGVYGETAMYDIAKQGATDAINAWKDSASTIGTIGSVS